MSRAHSPYFSHRQCLSKRSWLLSPATCPEFVGTAFIPSFAPTLFFTMT
jgi:hypothetical protein